jgi:hypothetical protein
MSFHPWRPSKWHTEQLNILHIVLSEVSVLLPNLNLDTQMLFTTVAEEEAVEPVLVRH